MANMFLILAERWALAIFSFIVFLATIFLLILLGRIFSANEQQKKKKKVHALEEDPEAINLLKSKDLDFDSFNLKVRQILAKEYHLSPLFDYSDLGVYFEEAELPRAEEFCGRMLDLESANEKQKKENLSLVLTMLKRFLYERSSYPSNHKKVKLTIIISRIKNMIISFIPKKGEAEEEPVLKREEQTEDEPDEEEKEEISKKPVKMHPVMEKVNDLEHLAEEVEKVQELMKNKKKRKLSTTKEYHEPLDS